MSGVLATFIRREGVGFFPPRGTDAGHDVAAALALAAIAIPEQMATARLAGAPAATGLLVFVAASFGFYLIGSNRALSAGADSTIAPIFAAGLAMLGMAGSPHYLALAAGLALMVGVMVAASGALRLGWIARLLSVPVITGFLAGIAVHIAVSQLPAMLGIAARGDFFAEILEIGRNIGHPNVFTLAIGVAVFAITFACEKIDIRLPGALIAIVLATLAVGLFGLADKGVTVLGAVQAARLGPPLSLSVADFGHLLPLALIVSLVVIIQTAATSRSFADPDGGDLNRDLMGVGAGNILSGLLGGFAANGSPPRTAIVRESGGRSRFAGLCAAVLVAALLLFGLQLLTDLPEAALAGLLLFVAQRIFRIDTMRTVAAESLAEFSLLAATAVAIVVAPIEIGVGIGVALSLLHGVWTIAQTHVIEFEKVPGTTVWWPAGETRGEKRAGIVVVGFQAPLFFLNAEAFRKSLEDVVRRTEARPHAIILEASSIVELDFSGAEVLADMIKFWKDQGMDFYVARLESVRAQKAFAKFGIMALLGQQRIFHSVDDAIRHLPG